ncbi:cysteine-rich secretory protein 2-like [Dromiciops gliroides]|uniref:cysteine-rich secretory protein 2-like n=1 Tax=Dromiciops gliroides TaxID=33562 RepID=UPI001CC3C14E|nr:cysteine-rich secretory protein 2-like [Dromiciops gliroides]
MDESLTVILKSQSPLAMSPRYGPGIPREPDHPFSFFSTHKASIQREIVNKHNELRRMTIPTAGNILKMAWNEEAALNAENWANKCTLSHSSVTNRKISCSQVVLYCKGLHHIDPGLFCGHLLGFSHTQNPNLRGNIQSDIRYKPFKVGKPCSDCPDHCDNGLCTNACMHVDAYTNCPQLTKSMGCEDHTMKEKCQATCK